jgi:hypothetical protein
VNGIGGMSVYRMLEAKPLGDQPDPIEVLMLTHGPARTALPVLVCFGFAKIQRECFKAGGEAIEVRSIRHTKVAHACDRGISHRNSTQLRAQDREMSE